MKKLMVALTFMLFAMPALATDSNTVSTIVDLELKITQKIKSIVLPVDPDVIVYTNITIKKINTELIGMQMSSVGIMATNQAEKIAESDIESVSVQVLTSLDVFPAEISKMLEGLVLGISKKGQVKVSRMDAKTSVTISKHKEFEKMQVDGYRKFEKFGDNITNILAQVPMVLGLIAVFQVLLMGFNTFFQSRTIGKLGKNIAAMKPAEASAPAPIRLEAPAERSTNAAEKAPTISKGFVEENPFKQMPLASLVSILSDAYWCQKDAYASWTLIQIPAQTKIELLEEWPPLQDYVKYLSQVEAKEDRFHHDPSYLKPQGYFKMSNVDLLAFIQKNKSQWSHLSLMRRQSMNMGLQERLDLMNVQPSAKTATWGDKISAPRVLPKQIEISQLNSEDEDLLFSQPDVLAPSLRHQFPSLVWVALLPTAERTEALEEMSAQSLAEIWSGPEQVLEKIAQVLPEKKKTLLNEYRKQVRYNRNSPYLKSLSTAALKKMETLHSQTEVDTPMRAAS
jgi:hypothetical protein